MLRFQSPPSSASQKSRLTHIFQAPQWGPLWRELPISGAFFYMSLEFLNKRYFDKKNHTLLLKALGKDGLPYVPQKGAPMEADAHFKSLP